MKAQRLIMYFQSLPVSDGASAAVTQQTRDHLLGAFGRRLTKLQKRCCNRFFRCLLQDYDFPLLKIVYSNYYHAATVKPMLIYSSLNAVPSLPVYYQLQILHHPNTCYNKQRLKL